MRINFARVDDTKIVIGIVTIEDILEERVQDTESLKLLDTVNEKLVKDYETALEEALGTRGSRTCADWFAVLFRPVGRGDSR